MRFIVIIAVLLAFALTTLCQNIHRVSGVIRNKEMAAVPGLSLSVEKDGQEYKRAGWHRGGFTDVNGEFLLDLEPGRYKITSEGIPENIFTLYLNIEEDGPKPESLDLTIDTSALCSDNLPTILKSGMPTYPPAARAVRAVGKVTVVVKIRADGTVESATASTGHPLLRKASEVGAMQFVFEGSSAAREATIHFLFTDAEKRGGLSRFECSSRIVVNAPAAVIDF